MPVMLNVEHVLTLYSKNLFLKQCNQQNQHMYELKRNYLLFRDKEVLKTSSALAQHFSTLGEEKRTK